MCSGGIINEPDRGGVVYGAADTKAGCCGSVTDLFALPFNHHPVVERGRAGGGGAGAAAGVFLRLREQRAAKPRWKPPVTPENVKKSGNCVKRRRFPLSFFVELCYII